MTTESSWVSNILFIEWFYSLDFMYYNCVRVLLRVDGIRKRDQEVGRLDCENGGRLKTSLGKRYPSNETSESS